MSGVSEAVTWSDERFRFRVECSPALLAAIDDEVCEGFAAAPSGGREKGGVLFGRVAADVVSILEYRPVMSRASTFKLTGETEARLKELLQAQGRTSRGVVPVGWYRSRARTQIRLSKADVDAYQRWFPEPWQVALVLSPDPGGPTHAAFFFREADGAVRSASAYEEFVIPRAGFDMPGDGAEEFTRREIAPRLRSRWWLWPLAALLLLLPFLAFFNRAGAPPPARGIGLQLFDSAGQMRISWNHQSGPVLRASAARLEIHEGPHMTSIDLDAGDLLAGGVYYWRSSGRTRVRLVLSGPGGELEESAELPASAWNPTAPPSEPAIAGTAPPEPESRPAAVDVGRSVSSASRETQAPEPQPRPPARTPAPRAFRYSAAVRPPPAAQPHLIAAPPPVRLPVTTAGTPPVPARVPEAPPKPAPAPPSPREARPPASGQIIWTGNLPRRGLVHIEEGKASQGYLSAPLPGTRSSVTVLPGEMTPAGLRLYTEDARLAGRAEPPGPQNGWNQTEYVWDPVRAAEITVLEAPIAQNNWKRMVIRSERRNYSVVVLRWETTPER